MAVIQRCKEYINTQIQSFYSSGGDEVDMMHRTLVCYIFHVAAAIVFAMATIWFALFAKGLLGEMNSGQQHHSAVLKIFYIGILVILIIIATLSGVAVVGLCVSFIFVLIISLRTSE